MIGQPRRSSPILVVDDDPDTCAALVKQLERVERLLRRAAPVAPSVAAKLTRRELEVLSLLAEGVSAADIAERLVISPKTVNTHIDRVLVKLGVRSRTQAVALAYRRELVPAPA